MTTRTVMRCELFLSGLFAVLFALTIVWRDWIEIVFGFDPDHHSGSLEWGIVAALFCVAVTFGVLARAQWRRLGTIAEPDAR